MPFFSILQCYSVLNSVANIFSDMLLHRSNPDRAQPRHITVKLGGAYVVVGFF